MSRRGKRRTLAPGIYEDDAGIAVVARIGTGAAERSSERRFPHGTKLRDLKLDQARRRAKLRDRDEDTPAKPGTFGQDVVDYLKTVPSGASHQNKAILLQHWVDAGFKDTPRHQITSLDIGQQLARWVNAGKATATANRRRSALMTFYAVLDGPTERNPVRGVPRLHEENDEPRGFSYAIVERILQALPDRGRPTGKGKGTRPKISQTKARLRVIAYTGFPQAVLELIRPHHLHLDGPDPSVDTLPRRKGRRTRAKRVPIIPQAVEAFRALIAADAFGRFSSDSMADSFGRAVTHAKAAWEAEQAKAGTHEAWPAPANLRPYDLRHCFGTETFLRTGDLQATAELMLLSDIRTAQRYARAAVPARARAARDAWVTPADPPPKRGTKRGTTKKSRKRS